MDGGLRRLEQIRNGVEPVELRESTGKVSQTTSRAKDLGLGWEAVEGLSDEELEK